MSWLIIAGAACSLISLCIFLACLVVLIRMGRAGEGDKT
jgi:hypothetical protein